jgi:hypothetical protein
VAGQGRGGLPLGLRPGLRACAAAFELLEEAGTAISMARVSEARQNGYAERLMRTI